MNISESRRRVATRETLVATNIPYMGHLSSSIVDTTTGDHLCVLRVAGAPFECADDAVISNRHNRLNRIVMSIADPRVTVWQNIVKREDDEYPDGDFPPGYARELNERYKEKVTAEQLLVNELYVTIVLRPYGSWTEGTLARLFSSRSATEIKRAREKQIEELDRIVSDLVAAMGYYEATRLEIYKRNGVLFSEPAEFFNYLVTGNWERVPYAPIPLKHMIGYSRPVFGNETIEMRGAENSHYGVMLGIEVYPSETDPTCLDNLLSLPFELVVTQSFQFHSRDAALLRMQMKSRRMENVGDAAQSQIDEIPDLADDLVARKSVMGGHHFSVLVKGDDLETLKLNVGETRRVLIDAGIRPAREDLGVEAAYWAQLPGNFNMRPRLSPINSRNMCGFIPLHNFPTGRRTGNHWGDALTMLVTAAGTPHYLSLHASDPQAKNGGNKKDVAHTVLLGPNGSGKTAAVSFVLAMLQKFGATSVLYSRDRDTEIIVRRLRGKVYRLRLNEPTGLAPLALDSEVPENVRHIQLLVRKMIRRVVITETGMEVDGKPLTVLEEKDLDKAIMQVLSKPKHTRRLGRVLDFLPKGDLYERLARWCYSREEGREDGQLAWVFDNPAATIADELGTVMTTVFDTTAFIDDAELRGPMSQHLFHLTERLVDGRRLAVFFSEFWKSMADEQFAKFLKGLLKTLRKKNGFVVLDSQSPSDALDHPLARTLLEQVATVFLFPNPGASVREYREGLSLSKREADLIKTDLPEGAGMFLLKQGRHSVVLKLPLEGMDEDLAVLSARTSNLELMDRLIAQYGEDPDAWISHFNQQRRSA